MNSSAIRRSLRLPKGWPRRVRSGVLHAISLAHFSLAFARSAAANSPHIRIRLQAKVERLRQEIALLQEEIRIKDCRMDLVPAHSRPHFPPVERLAILELRSARGWNAAQTAERFRVSPLTIASWMSRLDEEGPDALVQLNSPVNKFPEFVAYIVRRLKTLCPSMGNERIAQVLCRAGLHLGSTTVRRMLNGSPKRRPDAASYPASGRTVRAMRPNHVWNADLTTVPILRGFWVPWIPGAVAQRWPFCWWVAVAIDHFSRRVMGVSVFMSQPSSAAIRSFLDKTIRRHRASPEHLITDHGRQFTAKTFARWCRRHGIRRRFGAVGKYGSIAVVERFIRTLKSECTRRILVPYRLADFQRELSWFLAWYNAERPHSGLGARTPDEVYFERRPACRAPRFEPRPQWPRNSPCARPNALIRGRPGVQLELDVRFRHGRKHLPVVELRRAA